MHTKLPFSTSAYWALLAVFLATAAASAKAPSPADVVFVSGRVYTVDPARPWAEAVAIRGDRIIAVGTSREVRLHVGPRTRIVDLQGRMLMPGFVDGHNHVLSGVIAKRGANLTGARGREQMLERLRAYVTGHPEKSVYIGFGWSLANFSPGPHGTRHDLDAVCKDKPVFLFSDDNHHAWFNTRAMEMAGITRQTPDPVPGSEYFVREADGTPSGIAIEIASWVKVAQASGALGGREMLVECSEALLPRLPRAGITALHDMGIWVKDLPDAWMGFELLLDLDRAGRLPCRVVGTYATRAVSDPPEKHVATLKAWNAKYRSSLVAVTGLKLWADGTFLSHTGVQLEPYADRPDTRGTSPWTTDVLTRWVWAAHAAGFDVHVHVDGDASVRRTLDALEKASTPGGGGPFRDTLHHACVIHPDDLVRIKRLGAGVNGTAVWLVDYKGQYREARRILGEARVAREYGLHRDLIDNGVNVSFGSDIPGTDPWEIAPLFQIQAAVTGLVPGSHRGEVVVPPAHRLPTLAQMLHAYTMGGARQMRLEKEIGSLEVGKKADLIVLERNLFLIPPAQLSEVKVVLTVLDGRVVHDQDPLLVPKG